MPRPEDVDMSPRAVAARLATVSALNRLVQHLGAYRPAATTRGTEATAAADAGRSTDAGSGAPAEPDDD